MLKKLLGGYDMALALKHYKNGDIAKARVYLNRYFGRGIDEDPVAISFDATIFILEGRSEQAAMRFAKGRELANHGLTDSDATYVKSYCLYYECLIADGHNCDEHSEAARKVAGSAKVAKWLTLPEGSF